MSVDRHRSLGRPLDPALSGFHLMSGGQMALHAPGSSWCAAPAAHSLDVQCYHIHDDETGTASSACCATPRGGACASACCSTISTPRDRTSCWAGLAGERRAAPVQPLPGRTKQPLSARCSTSAASTGACTTSRWSPSGAIASRRSATSETNLSCSATASTSSTSTRSLSALPSLSALLDTYWNSRHALPLEGDGAQRVPGRRLPTAVRPRSDPQRTPLPDLPDATTVGEESPFEALDPAAALGPARAEPAPTCPTVLGNPRMPRRRATSRASGTGWFNISALRQMDVQVACALRRADAARPRCGRSAACGPWAWPLADEPTSTRPMRQLSRSRCTPRASSCTRSRRCRARQSVLPSRGSVMDPRDLLHRVVQLRPPLGHHGDGREIGLKRSSHELGVGTLDRSWPGWRRVRRPRGRPPYGCWKCSAPSFLTTCFECAPLREALTTSPSCSMKAALFARAALPTAAPTAQRRD